MNASTKSQLTSLALGALALTLVAVIVREAMKPEPSKEVVPAAAQAPPVAAPEPGSPEAELAAQLTLHVKDKVDADTPGLEAYISGKPNLRYNWFIEGGTMELGGNSSTFLWRSGAPGTATLTCHCTDEAGITVALTGSVKIVPPASIVAFEAVNPVVTAGWKTTLKWETKDAAALTLDPGGQDLLALAKPQIEVKPERTTTYLLTAQSAAGSRVIRELVLKVVPPPVLLNARVEGQVGVGKPITLVCEFAEGTAEIRQGGAVLASGTESPLRVQAPDPSVGTSFLFTVTNEAKAVASQPFSVAAPPKASNPAR